MDTQNERKDTLKTRVFISYSRKDGAFLERLATALDARSPISARIPKSGRSSLPAVTPSCSPPAALPR